MNTDLARQVLDEETRLLEKRLRSLETKQRRFVGPLEEKLKLVRYYRAVQNLRTLRRKNYFEDLKQLEAV